MCAAVQAPEDPSNIYLSEKQLTDPECELIAAAMSHTPSNERLAVESVSLSENTGSWSVSGVSGVLRALREYKNLKKIWAYRCSLGSMDGSAALLVELFVDPEWCRGAAMYLHSNGFSQEDKKELKNAWEKGKRTAELEL